MTRSIFQLPLSGSLQHDGDCDQHDAAFNSLSRDHSLYTIENRELKRAMRGLSTPSLGITAGSLQTQARDEVLAFNSLSRDH